MHWNSVICSRTGEINMNNVANIQYQRYDVSTETLLCPFSNRLNLIFFCSALAQLCFKTAQINSRRPVSRKSFRCGYSVDFDIQTFNFAVVLAFGAQIAILSVRVRLNTCCWVYSYRVTTFYFLCSLQFNSKYAFLKRHPLVCFFMAFLSSFYIH